MNLKQYRQEQGMTAKELGDMLGVTAQTIFKWECGCRAPKATRIKQIQEWSQGKVTINDFNNV